MSWQAIGKGIKVPAPSGFEFPLAVDPNNPERAWFMPVKANACRIPADGRMVVNRTGDGGKTFTAFSDGLHRKTPTTWFTAMGWTSAPTARHSHWAPPRAGFGRAQTRGKVTLPIAGLAADCGGEVCWIGAGKRFSPN